jgi:hypothetical protein
MPDETMLVDTLVRTVKVLVWTLHLLERDRFEWMTVESCVQLRCCGNLREFQILESKRMSESDSANCQDSFLCPAKMRHSLLDAVDVLSASQDATANVSQALAQSSSSNQLSMNLILELGKSEHIKQTKHQKPSQAKKYTIFLGHTGQDSTASNFAAFLSHECKREQVSCFYDAGSICPGIFYDACIQDAVKTCEVFISILSPTYFKRYWCMHELDLAIQADRHILPVFYGIEGDVVAPKSCVLVNRVTNV